MMDTKELLAERGKTHGHFPDHAAVTQLIKAAIYSPRAYLPSLSGAIRDGIDRYDAVQREGLEMIAHKIGRIVAGDPQEPDHWADIAGYARLVADHLERQRKPSQTIVFREQGKPEAILSDWEQQARERDMRDPMRDQILEEAGILRAAIADGFRDGPPSPSALRLDPAGDETTPPAPPKMYEAGTRTCKACGAPAGTHYGACPLKPKPQPLDI